MQAQESFDQAALREFVVAQSRQSWLPTVAVAVVRPGQPAFYAFAGPGTPGADTPFLLGSVTKTITALAVAQLVDEGRLRFDDLVVQALPGFTLASADATRALTVRHLLTHTSGFRQWDGHDRRAQGEGVFTHLAPGAPPGTRFEYSSLNYVVLGKVIEAASGRSYSDWLRSRVFEPLEMDNSSAEPAGRARGLLRGHRFLFGLTVPGSERPAPGPLVPAGFVVSTARDMGHYLEALLDGGRFRGRTIVSEARLRELLTPWDGSAAGPGMGWGVGRTRIGHAGSTPTFSARVALLPDQGRGVVVLANVNSGPFFAGTGVVVDGVVGLLRGETVATRLPSEILLRVALLVGVVWSAVQAAWQARRWRRAGAPRRLAATRRALTPLALEGSAALLALVGLPRWLGIPLGTLIEYFPDFGLALVAGAVTGMAGALLKSLLLAAEPGHHETP